MQAKMPEPDLPYPEGPLDSVDWDKVPLREIAVTALVPTQEGLSLYTLAYLVNGGEPKNDCQVVWHKGRLYIHNGHHRWAIAWLTGARLMSARVVEIRNREAVPWQ